MNYFQILRDAWRLFRTTKLVWVLGFLSIAITMPLVSSLSGRATPLLECLQLPITFAGFILMMTATGGLYWVIAQTFFGSNIPFSEAWQQGKTKLLRNIGLIMLGIPIFLMAGNLIKLIISRSPSSPFLWLVVFVESIVFAPFLAFACCAVMIDNANVWSAAKTGFLITLNNFSPAFVITGSLFLARLLLNGLVIMILASGLFRVALPTPLALDYPTYQKLIAIPIVSWISWLGNLVFSPMQDIMLTFAYLHFAKESASLVLVQKETTA